jgi:hypothetical protein
LAIADRRIADFRLQIDGLQIGECRSTDCRLASADRRMADFRLQIDGLQIGDWLRSNHQSSIRRSTIVNLQSVDLQSAICHRQ